MRLYFGYGSNLNEDDWRRCCEELGFGEDDRLVAAGRAWLPDYALVFGRRSSGRRGGVLDVRPHRGGLVPGALFEARGRGREALDEKEGVRIDQDGANRGAYQALEHVALTSDGREVPVWTYEVCPARREAFVEPSAEYVRIVREGWRAYGLDDRLLDRIIASGGPAHEAPEGIFVYGTLMQGEERFHAFGAHFESATPAETRGRLLDLGAYPGLVLDASSRVRGELIRVSGMSEVLATLDGIEGFRGYGEEGSLYRRALVDVDTGGGVVLRAWTYVYAQEAPNAPAIASGDWRDR